MQTDFDRKKSLQELEGEDWGEPTYKSGLVINCHRLRRVPLKDLTPADCQLLLGQNISAPFLVPLALEWLRENPLLQARFYPGDLPGSVLGLRPEFWAAHPGLCWEMREVVTEVECIRDGLEHISKMEAAFMQAQPESPT